MESFTKMVKDFQLLTSFAKSSILDVRLGSRYASVIIISKTKSGFHGCNIAWGFCLFETNWTFSFAFFQLTFLLRFFCLKIVCFTNEHMIYPHKRYCYYYWDSIVSIKIVVFTCNTSLLFYNLSYFSCFPSGWY